MRGIDFYRGKFEIRAYNRKGVVEFTCCEAWRCEITRNGIVKYCSQTPGVVCRYTDSTLISQEKSKRPDALIKSPAFVKSLKL